MTRAKVDGGARRGAFARRREEFARGRAEFARRSIPELIDLLESEDLRTRFLAEMCLRDKTNT